MAQVKTFMNQVFISYSRKDEIFARQLAADLDRDGLDVWIDVEDIPPGANWSNAINDGLNRADLMLLVLTPNSVDSKNVEDEWQYFHNQGKPIIPLWLEPSGRLHYQLARLQYVDFKDLEYEEAYDQMLIEMRNKGFEVERLSETIARVEAQRSEAELERDRLQQEIEALQKAAAERDRLRRELDAVQEIDAERQRLKDQLVQLHQEEELYEQVKESEKKRQTATDTNPMSTLNLMPDTDTAPTKNRELRPSSAPKPRENKKASPRNALDAKPTEPAPPTLKVQSQVQSQIASTPMQDNRPRYSRGLIMGGLGIVVLIIAVIALSGLLAGGDDPDGSNNNDKGDSGNQSILAQVVLYDDFGETEIKTVAWSPLGDKFALGATDGLLYIYAANDEYYEIKYFEADSSILELEWNSDGTRLASFTETGILNIWNFEDDDSDNWGDPLKFDVHSIMGNCDGDHSIDWYHDENWVAVGCPDAPFILNTDYPDDWYGDKLPSEGTIEKLAWSNTYPAYLAVVESDDTVSIWDVSFDEEDQYFAVDEVLRLDEYGFEMPSGGIADLAWHQSEYQLAIGGISGGQSDIQVWYINPDGESTVYLGPNYYWEFELNQIAWESEGAFLAAIDRDEHVVGFWNNYAGENNLTEYEYQGDGKIWSLDWHPWKALLLTSQIEVGKFGTSMAVWDFKLDPHQSEDVSQDAMD